MTSAQQKPTGCRSKHAIWLWFQVCLLFFLQALLANRNNWISNSSCIHTGSETEIYAVQNVHPENLCWCLKRRADKKTCSVGPKIPLTYKIPQSNAGCTNNLVHQNLLCHCVHISSNIHSSQPAVPVVQNETRRAADQKHGTFQRENKYLERIHGKTLHFERVRAWLWKHPKQQKQQ